MKKKWDTAVILRVAAEACVDPRTVRRYAEGNKVTNATRTCIEMAAKKLGLK